MSLPEGYDAARDTLLSELRKVRIPTLGNPTKPHRRAAHGTRADQIGSIRIVDHARLLSEPFLDLRPWLKEVTPAYDERGLLGLAFHPQFDRKDHPGFRKFYTFTREPPGPCEVPLANAADRVDHLNVVTDWRVSDDNNSRSECMTASGGLSSAWTSMKPISSNR
jgi:hypothetical protein